MGLDPICLSPIRSQCLVDTTYCNLSRNVEDVPAYLSPPFAWAVRAKCVARDSLDHDCTNVELKIGNVSKKEDERKIFHARSSNKGSTFGLTTSLLSRLLSPKSTMYSIKYLTYCISVVTLSAIRLNNSILSLYSSQMSAIQITWETVWKEEMNNSVRAMLISNGREGLKEKEGNRIEPCTIYTNWTALLEVRNNRWARCWSGDTRAASKRLYSQRRFDCSDRGKIRSRLVVARASRYFSSDDAMSSYECNKIYKI